MNFKQLLIIALFFSIALSNATVDVLAQTGVRVSGLVTDADGQAIPGANVQVPGTTQGTVTDLDGRYMLDNVPGDGNLLFSFIGFLREEVPVQGRSVINVSLMPDIQELEAVVVIGYGTQKKSDLTGSVAVVDADWLNRSAPVNVDNALRGKAAGVHVSSTSGKPGSAASVKIRGIGSISLNSEPLYVIDGMYVGHNELAALNPNDIASLQVLKDASAAAIYGTQGANGVVVITTKRGEKGGISKIDFSANHSVSNIPKRYDVMNAAQYTEFTNLAYDNDIPRYPSLVNNYTRVYSDSARLSNNNAATDTDWQDVMTRQAMGQNYNLSVSGGSENANFHVSGNYLKEEGTLIPTDFERISLMANSDYKVGKRITIGESINMSRIFTNDDAHYRNSNPWVTPLSASPFMSVYSSDYSHGYGGPVDSLVGANFLTNPFAEQMLNRQTTQEYRINANFYTDVEITSWLKYSFKVGLNYKQRFNSQFSPTYRLGNVRTWDLDLSRLTKNNSIDNGYLYTHMFTFNKSFSDHNFTFLAGFERMSAKGEWTNTAGADLANLHLPVLQQAQSPLSVGGGESDRKLESYLGRVLYDYKNKFLFTASIRRDGSSRFGPENRYGNFPSFSAGYKINEDFLQSMDQINMLKIRAGWGVTGNENLNDYVYYALLDPPANSRYSFGTNQALWLGVAPTSDWTVSNTAIKWESTKMLNVGVDLAMFRNKIEFTGEYYVKTQEDMLVRRLISANYGRRNGFPNHTGAWVNLAQVENRGFEFNLIYKEVKGDFNYLISGNLTTIQNKVVSLGEGVAPIMGGTSLWSDGLTRTANDQTIGAFYGYVADGILQMSDFQSDPVTGALLKDDKGNYIPLGPKQEDGTSPGDIRFKDLNKDGRITVADQTYIGKPLPDMVYGLQINVGYKYMIDLSISLQGMHNLQVNNQIMATVGVGTDRMSQDQNKLVSVLTDSWTPDNPTNSTTRASVTDANNNTRNSSWFIEDASFLRIANVQLGYNLPSSLINRVNISKLRVYVSSNNLFVFTKYTGLDPEVGNKNPLGAGIDAGNYPIPRVFMVGLQLGL